jgi:outer membrane protein assembly factor BamB
MVGDDIVTGWYYGRRMPVVYVHTGAAVDSRTGTLTGAVGIGPTETVRGDVVVSSTTEPAGPALDTRSFAVTHLDDPSLSWTATFQYFDFFGTPQGGIGGGMTLGADRLYQAGGGADSTAPGQGSYGNGVRAFPVGNGQAGCGPAGRNLACPLWFTPLAGALTAPPVIAPDQSTVYVVANVTSGSVVNGTLHALDAATGAIRWTASLGVAGRTPALADGTLYVPTSDGRLLVFAAGGCGAATCGPSWEASTGTGSGIGQPAVAGGLVFTGSGDGTVHAFTAAGCGSASCPPLWSASASTTVSVVALAVSNGRLFVRTGDGTLTTYGLP